MKKRLYLITALIFFTFLTNNCKDLTEDKLTVFNKSIQYEQEKKYDLALKEMQKLQKEFSEDYFTNLRLGWLYFNNKSYSESIKYYNNANKLAGNKSIEALLGLTYPLDAQTKNDELINVYKRILEIDNNNYTANLKLGIIYYYQKNYQNAKSFLTKIHNFYSSDYYINLYLGWTYFYLNNKNAAKHHFIYALINDSNDSSAKQGLASCR